MSNIEILNVDNQDLSADMYDEVEQIAGIGSWIFDTATRQITFSENFYRLLQLPPGKKIDCLEDIGTQLHPNDELKLQYTKKLMYEEHRIPGCEYRIVNNEGIVRQLKQKGSVYTDKQGNKYLKGYIQEVPYPALSVPVGCKEDLQKLNEELRFANLICDASIDRTWVIDMDYRIVSWNRRSEIITDIPKANVAGKQLFEVFPKMQECPDVIKGISHAMKGYTVFVPADKCQYEDGYYEDHFIPLKDEDCKVTGVLNIKHDVAHRVKAERELKMLNKSLARKNKEMKRRNAELRSFAHVTSHDLKEPLRKIYTFVELILNKETGQLSDTGKTHFKRVQALVQRMSLLTDDMLTFSELDNESSLFADVDLSHTLAFVKNNLAELIEEKGAVIIANHMPLLRGYRAMLTQLFQNIISNGLKFQSEGNKPVIQINAEHVKGNDLNFPDALADVNYLKISFTDNGIGFDKRYVEQMFEMFKRLPNAEKYQGSGIGLAICKKIAELHHGFIMVETKVNEGSTFCCYLQDGML